MKLCALVIDISRSQQLAAAESSRRLSHDDPIHDDVLAGSDIRIYEFLFRRNVGEQYTSGPIELNRLPALQRSESNDRIVARIELDDSIAHSDGESRADKEAPA